MKTLGQVGYEAMLRNMQSGREVAGWEYDAGIHDWESQPQKLRDDWEKVGEAIAKAVLVGGVE